MRQNLIITLFLLFLSLPLIYPFLQPGYFPTHDGEWAIVRLAEMHREIKDLQISPRWSGFLNHGYGYPLFLFTYPFPYYVGEIIYIVGIGLTDTIKLLFVLSILGSIFTMYLLGNELWGKWGGIVSAVFYLYAPYRATNLYERGSLGESLALIFFPLLIYLTYKFTNKFSFRLFSFTSLVFAAFILTHNAMVVLFAPWLFFWVLIRNNKQYVLLSLFIGLLLAAYFWLPAIMEKRHIALSQIPLANRQEYFLTLQQLFMPKTVFSSIPQVTVGWPYIIISLLGAIYIFINNINLNRHCERLKGAWQSLRLLCLFAPRNDGTSKSDLIDLFLLVGLFVSITLLLPISNPIWQLPLLSEIDFPWRNLNVVIFFISLLGGWLITQKFGKIVVTAFIIAVILTGLGNIKIGERILKADEYYETNDATTTSADELMPIWVSSKPTNKQTSLVKTTHKDILVPYEMSQQFEVQITSLTSDEVILNKLYFPGWNVYQNGKKTPISITDKTGLISFQSLSGTNTYNVVFERTPVRLIADTISIIGLVSLITIWIYSRKYYRLS